MGLSVAGAGTHPLIVREETEVSGAVRYRALNVSMRVLASASRQWRCTGTWACRRPRTPSGC